MKDSLPEPERKPPSPWRRRLTHLALPVLTVGGLAVMATWIVSADPGPEVGPSAHVEPRPRPSALEGIRFVTVQGDKVTREIQAATAAFDFQNGYVYYGSVEGIVDTRDLGRVTFRADRGRSDLAEHSAEPDLSELKIETIDLEGNVRFGGDISLEPRGGIRFYVEEGILDALDIEGTLQPPRRD